MSPAPSNAEPTRLVAGDTWQWRRSASPSYPLSEGWALTYAIVGKEKLDWNPSWVTNDGATYTIVIPADESDLPAGRYRWTAYAVGTGSYVGQRFTIASGVLVIDPDPAKAKDGDGQPHAEKMLALIEACIEGRLPADIDSYSIGNRSVKLMDQAELRRWRRYYRVELFKLRNPGQALPGERATFSRVT